MAYNNPRSEKARGLTPYLSQWGAWAFSIGVAIGWGSLVVASNTYLVQAGPAGSVLGLLVGAAVMLVMARNYHYLMVKYPDSGGAYTFAKKVFGHDHAFFSHGLAPESYFLFTVALVLLLSNYSYMMNWTTMYGASSTVPT